MSTTTPNQHPSRFPLPTWAIGTLALLVLVLLAGSGWWLFTTIQTMVAENQVQTLQSPEFELQATPLANPIINSNDPNQETGSSPEVLEEMDTSPQVWEGRERVTILIMGVDKRCGEDGPTRTDSLMLLTIDPVGKTAGILSLPRDLWVEIPGFGINRINQAHYFGEGFEYPGGGPALAVKTVEATLGVKIHHYATINFETFIEVVNLLGGITVDVPEAINDPKYPDSCYGFDPFSLPAGRQQLTGEQALKFARTRATLGGDVDRADRQQLVVLAVREQAVAQFGELLLQAPAFWQTLQKNVRTTLTLDEAVELAWLVQEIPSENIRRAVIDYNDVYVEKTPEGEDVLVPIRENIAAIRNELFAPPAAPPISLVELLDEMTAENAKVAVWNGTQTFGLAGETQTYLLSKEIQVTEIGNADSSTYASTQVIDYGEHPYTTQYLVQLMGIPPLNITAGERPEGDYDVLIILGNDWEVPGD